MNPEEEVALLKLRLAYLEDSLAALELNNSDLLSAFKKKSNELAATKEDLLSVRATLSHTDAALADKQYELGIEKTNHFNCNSLLSGAKSLAIRQQGDIALLKKKLEGQRYYYMSEYKKEVLYKMDGYLMALSEIGHDGNQGRSNQLRGGEDLTQAGQVGHHPNVSDTPE